MQISARVDDAVRAMLEIAVVSPEHISRDDIAHRHELPTRDLEPILRDVSEPLSVRWAPVATAATTHRTPARCGPTAHPLRPVRR